MGKVTKNKTLGSKSKSLIKSKEIKKAKTPKKTATSKFTKTIEVYAD